MPTWGAPSRPEPVPLLNEREVPPGVHHDVQHPVPVTVTLRWATGTEQLDTIALEWWGPNVCHRGDDEYSRRESVRDRALVRVRVADTRVMTGAVWVPAGDVRRR